MLSRFGIPATEGIQMNIASSADRFCDLVMKGGVTSGVVYPPAIFELAQHYHFRSIRGTSAGAIAAAVTAAAEYQRRTLRSMRGFELLAELPTRLGKKGAGDRTQLLRLFQPDVPCRRLFSVLIDSLNQADTLHRIGAIFFGCIKAYWIASLVSIAAAFLIALQSMLAGFISVLILAPLAIGISIYRDLTQNVVKNNYGLCKGMTVDPGAGDALTPWLHNLIQEAAGRTANDPPLTFGDLWRAPGAPHGDNARSIDLQMFTTNLAHGRPYIFPHSEPTARLFYRSNELHAYLPASVMDWFDAHSMAYAPSRQSPQSDPPAKLAEIMHLRELPPPEDFPILLAARMSLSFPVLFSAVPLWAIDYDWPRGQRTFRRCMFSDGGISSNFPIHQFDGLLPLWPTFGIDLEAKLPGYDDMIYLPQKCPDGCADRWTRFDTAPESASRFGGFLSSIVATMQNWNNNALARMPGVRDRVVRLRLQKDEGGFNLNMPGNVMNEIVGRGRDAATEIIKRYVAAGVGARPAAGWDQQRWTRRDVLLRALNERMAGLAQALGQNIPHASSYQELTQRAAREAPPCHVAPLAREETEALDALTDALSRIAYAFGQNGAGYPDAPFPQPELRMRPPL
jgi:predicted acylesterase/phospholipase RssA